MGRRVKMTMVGQTSASGSSETSEVVEAVEEEEAAQNIRFRHQKVRRQEVHQEGSHFRWICYQGCC
jgi:hypothetical protein